MDLEPGSILLEPTPDVFVFVIRSIVLNQMDALRSAGSIGARQMVEKAKIGVRVEDGVSAIGKLCGTDFDRAENLDALSLPRNRDQGLVPHLRPCLVERGVLSETGFVFEENESTFLDGFFLMLG